MISVFRKELRSYFVSPIPYVLVVIFVSVMALIYFNFQLFWVTRRASLESLFQVVPLVFILLIPGITMRLWSEEAREGTLETLMTSPVRSWQLVGGKFLSAWVLLAVCLLCTLGVGITVSSLGNLDWGPVVGGYLGALLMGGALLAFGLWISSLTDHQIVAYLLTAVGIFALAWVLPYAAGEVEGSGRQFLTQLSVAGHYRALGRGVVDLRDVLYFVTFATFFLYLNAQAVENRRYR